MMAFNCLTERDTKTSRVPTIFLDQRPDRDDALGRVVELDKHGNVHGIGGVTPTPCFGLVKASNIDATT